MVFDKLIVKIMENPRPWGLIPLYTYLCKYITVATMFVMITIFIHIKKLGLYTHRLKVVL